jgi:hypothetical protein
MSLSLWSMVCAKVTCVRLTMLSLSFKTALFGEYTFSIDRSLSCSIDVSVSFTHTNLYLTHHHSLIAKERTSFWKNARLSPIGISSNVFITFSISTKSLSITWQIHSSGWACRSTWTKSSAFSLISFIGGMSGATSPTQSASWS